MEIKEMQQLTLIKATDTFNGFCYYNHDNFKKKKGIVYIGESGLTSGKTVEIDGEIYFILETIDSEYIETYDSMWEQTKEFFKKKKDRLYLLEVVYDMLDWQHSLTLMHDIYDDLIENN